MSKIGTYTLLTALVATSLFGKGQTTYDFNNLEKECIAVGKASDIKSEVANLAKYISKKAGRQITTENLLDGNNSNYELKNISIDDTDSFNTKVRLKYFTPNGSEKTVGYNGFMDVPSKIFFDNEEKSVKRSVKAGLNYESTFNGYSNKLENMQKVIDVKHGKVTGVKIDCTPSVEHQLGFNTISDMEKVVSNTKSVDFHYVPNDSFSLGVGKDIKVTYNMNDGSTIERFNNPSILKFVFDYDGNGN